MVNVIDLRDRLIAPRTAGFAGVTTVRYGC
jgi:hypothetical protein